MKLASTTTATSYTLVVDGDFGWAICTIDDAAGVLSIVSDWGNWSHRWSPEPRHLGAPTLTAFLARGSTDYVADKLQGAGRGRRFSAELTVAAWRKMLCERRLAAGRRVEVVTRLSREEARRVWDELEDLIELDDRSLFVDHAYDIDGVIRWITDVPYEYLGTEQTPEDRALREVVLPAMFEALRAKAAAAPCSDAQAWHCGTEIAANQLLKRVEELEDAIAELLAARGDGARGFGRLRQLMASAEPRSS